MRAKQKRTEMLTDESQLSLHTHTHTLYTILPTGFISDAAGKTSFCSSFPLHNLPHLTALEGSNPSIPQSAQMRRWGEEQHFSPLLRDKQAAPSCQLCLLHPSDRPLMQPQNSPLCTLENMARLTREGRSGLMHERTDHQTLGFFFFSLLG